jgi:hypothetical protein
MSKKKGSPNVARNKVLPIMGAPNPMLGMPQLKGIQDIPDEEEEEEEEEIASGPVSFNHARQVNVMGPL